MNVLLVDDEVDLVEIMEFLVQSSFSDTAVVYKAFSGNEAIEILKKNEVDLCICDHNMPDGMGKDVLKFIIDFKLSTKFVLNSTVLPRDKPQDYPAVHVFSNIQKPDIGGGLELLKLKLEKESAVSKAPKVSKVSMDDYVPISIHLLEIMEQTPSDVFIKMSESRFVKVLNAGEDFTEADKTKYSSKPLEILYMKKTDQKTSVDKQIDIVLQKMMDKKSISLEEKLTIAHTQLVELIKFTGITPELAEMTKKNIQQSVAFINKSPLLADFWKGFILEGGYPSKLYTLHSMLSSLVVRKMEWNSDATQFKLSLSAFLQDISLDSIALMELCDYQEFLLNESRFSRAEIKKYNEHPQKAVEILASFKDIPPDIDRILVEQHEMPNGDGFPKKLKATQLGPLSCVFILTGVLARYILREGSKFDLGKFISRMEEQGYSKGNFKDSFEIIKNFK